MTVDFQQTSTAAFGKMIIPAGGLAENGTSIFNVMKIGGNVSHVESEITLGPLASRSCVAFLSPFGQPGDGSVWTAGTFTVRLHVHLGSGKIKWSHVWICRINSFRQIQEVIGSDLTILGRTFGGAEHQTFSLDVSVVASPAALSSDVLYIIYGFTNGHRNASRTVMISPFVANTAHWVLADSDRFIVLQNWVSADCTLAAPNLQIPRIFTVLPVNAACDLAAPALLNPSTVVVSAAVNASATVIAPTVLEAERILNPLPVNASATLLAPTIQRDRTLTPGIATASCTVLEPTRLGGAGVLNVWDGANWIPIGGVS